MTPLVLLVGFLGAGKTTYLRALIPALTAEGLQPHVIINDYQNARVDAELLRELTETVVPISGSCVCCGSRDELLESLTAFQPGPGRVVVVETNGTTDAEALVELLSLEPTLHALTQPIQLSLIDAKRWQKRFWHNALELEQTRTAGFVSLSRWDEVDGKRRDAVDASLAKNGVRARRVTPAEFAGELRGVEESVRDAAGRGTVYWIRKEKSRCHEVSHFSSLQIDLPPVVERAALAGFLDGLPREVVRVKGLARLADSPEEYHVFQRVEDGETQWLPIGREPRVDVPVAVLIGPGLDAGALAERAAEYFSVPQDGLPG
jgi:G3E family GTPase